MKRAILLYGATALGASEFSSDLLWRTGFSVPDPVLLCEIDGKKILFLSPLEIERGRREAKVDEVIPAVDVQKTSSLLKERGVEEITIPATLQYSLGASLAEYFKLVVKTGSLYPERAIKTEVEIKELDRAQHAVEGAVRQGMNFLKECRVKGALLFHSEFPDTSIASRHLRKIIDDALYLKGYLGVESIVSCGIEAVDPHCKGYGNLKPGEPIILDIFPRSLETLYFTDQTRTVFKGEPSEKMKRMYSAVLTVQEMALGEIKNNADMKIISQKVRDYFINIGYPTDLEGTPVRGFIHGLGHGVGIDIHEEPNGLLTAGNIITVEPGLYYPEENDTIPRGGIRIEDMVLVTDQGNTNFTKFPKSLNDIIIE